jgi:predicted MFS family arabinose efflux permease
VGGIVGARLSRPLVARYGAGRVLRGAGTLRACWPVGLAFVMPGAGGLALVMGLQFGLLVCIGVFNPVYATERLKRTPDDRVARVLAAWTVSSNLTVAAMTALWGVLAAAVGVREAVALAGALMLATPLLLRTRAPARGTRARP